MLLQVLLILAGTSAVQGSCYWWARGHRSHHRYTDSELDPYNAKRGLLYSHIGWMLVKPRIRPGKADISDLQKNAIVQWQHRWYFFLICIFGYGLPMSVAGLLWNDWRGGFFYAGAVRITVVHHVSLEVEKFQSVDEKLVLLASLVRVLHQFHCSPLRRDPIR